MGVVRLVPRLTRVYQPWMTSELPFWRRKALDEMSSDEWESLCDGCGKCCLIKLEDEDSGDIIATDVTCKLLDLGTCRCRHYNERIQHVPDCVTLTPDNIGSLAFMPSTCAYRMLAEGKPLAPWHPLVSGDPNSVHAAGISVLGRAVSEVGVPDAELEDHVIDWFDGPDAGGEGSQDRDTTGHERKRGGDAA